MGGKHLSRSSLKNAQQCFNFQQSSKFQETKIRMLMGRASSEHTRLPSEDLGGLCLKRADRSRLSFALISKQL